MDDITQGALLTIKALMEQVVEISESINLCLHQLKVSGIELPNMEQTARRLDEIARGWQAGE